MLFVLIAAGILVCSVQAVRVKRLLTSALWLAGSSALVAILLYVLGAPEIAVIELSVGAGLVTVLFVFAINIAGEEALNAQPVLPRPLAWGFVLLGLLLLAVLAWPALGIPLPANQLSQFATTLWEDRSLDVLLQLVLIFSGVLGVLGLLAQSKPHPAQEGKS